MPQNPRSISPYPFPRLAEQRSPQSRRGLPPFIAYWLLLLIGLGQGSCDGPTSPIVVIALSTVPDGVTRLTVQPTLDGKPGLTQTLDVQAGDSPRFGIVVPADSLGTLQVQIVGTDAGACRSAEGADTLVLSGQRLPLQRNIVLTALPVARCPIRVQITAGMGRVQSQPDGLDCSHVGGTCAIEVDQSSSSVLRLSVTPTADSYFVFSGDCSGIGDCIVSQNQARTIAVAFDPRPCDPGSGICSYSPLPSAGTYVAIASISSEQAWAAGQSGDSGSVLRFNQGRWHRVPIPATAPLRDIWTSSTSTWAVGDAGTLLRWDGTQFQTVLTGVTESLFGVWGSSDQDVWAVGDLGVILHYDGTAVSRVANPLGAVRLNAIWGSAAGEVFTVGGSGTVLRWDGAAWQVMPSPSSFVSLVSVFGSSPSDVYVLGGRSAWRWNGSEWTLARQEGTALQHGFARSPSDVWILRAGGQLLHFDGATWTRDQVAAAARQLLALASAGSDGIWVGGSDGEIHLGRAGAWSQRSGYTYSPGLGVLSQVFAVASDDVWACGDYQTLHWNGTLWRSEGPDTVVCGALFGTATDDIWMVGKAGFVLHYDGVRWQHVASLSDAKVVSGFSISRSLAYIIGSFPGVVYRWNGTSWNKDTTVGANNDYRDVWASSASDVWLVLNAGYVQRYNGSTWTLERPAQPPFSFASVSGRGPNQVFLVGDQLTRWNGVTYINDPNPLPESMGQVQALPDGTALAISASGSVIRWSGGQWSALQTPLPGLQQLAPLSASDIWFVGDRSSLWRLQR